MHDHRLQAGREFFDFRRPVGQQRGGRHQQARPTLRTAILALLRQQQRQNLDRLAEPHVVGKAGAEPQSRQQMQPLHAGLLIRPQQSVQRRTRVDTAPSGARSPAASPPARGRPSRATSRRRSRPPRRRRPPRPPASASPRRRSARPVRPVLRPRGIAAARAPAVRGRLRPIGRAAAPGSRCRRAVSRSPARSALAVQRDFHAEIEQPIEADGRWRACADRRRDLRARRAVRPP